MAFVSIDSIEQACYRHGLSMAPKFARVTLGEIADPSQALETQFLSGYFKFYQKDHQSLPGS